MQRGLGAAIEKITARRISPTQGERLKNVYVGGLFWSSDEIIPAEVLFLLVLRRVQKLESEPTLASVSALTWKRLCKRRTQHQKIADIFQSGAKWQKMNVFPIENTLSIILIQNRMVMSGDVLFPGLRNFAFCFFLLVFTVVWKRPMKGTSNHF